MRTRIEEQLKRAAAVSSVMLIAAAEAMAQNNQSRVPRRIVVSIPDRKMAVMESDRVVRIFPVAVGATRTPSPTGVHHIISHVTDPAWYTKGRIVPPGKSNPLGTRWMGLSLKGYGIHGTNRPSSIGHNASHGCIRMRNHDVEEVFEIMAVGDTVELVNERTEEVTRIFGSEPEPRVVAHAPAPVRIASAN